MSIEALERRGTLALDRGMLPTADVVSRVMRIQEIMQAVMKKDVHFGTIPGTPKPTLYKPGAELLLMTFRIAPTPSEIEDLSTPDEIRYRVTVRGTNQVSGEIVGEMVGECSSNEEKYRWRKPVCEEEFTETPEDRRREKWAKGSNGVAYKQKQVRTSPADVANTILKMATKRALIAMTLVSLAASDIFAQDIEDLQEELRESIAGDEAPRSETKQPQRRSATGNGGATSKPLPADAKTVVGVIGKVYEDKKPYALYLKGSQTKYTTFDEELWKDIKQFVGTDHQVKLAYAENVKNNTTYYNAIGIAVADAEPATKPPASGKTKEEAPLTDQDIFGAREPGSEG